VRVVLVHLGAEDALREFAPLESIGRLRERVRHARQVARGINIANEDGGRLNAVRDAVEAGGKARGEREVRICIGTSDAALDAQAAALADDAEAGRAVVIAPREASA